MSERFEYCNLPVTAEEYDALVAAYDTLPDEAKIAVTRADAARLAAKIAIGQAEQLMTDWANGVLAGLKR